MSDSQTPQPLTSAEREKLLASAKFSKAAISLAIEADPQSPDNRKLEVHASLGLAEIVLQYEATVRSLEQRCEALEVEKQALIEGHVALSRSPLGTAGYGMWWLKLPQWSMPRPFDTADEALQAYRNAGRETRGVRCPNGGLCEFTPGIGGWHFAPNRQMWGTEERAHVTCVKCKGRTWINRGQAQKQSVEAYRDSLGVPSISSTEEKRDA